MAPKENSSAPIQTSSSVKNLKDYKLNGNFFLGIIILFGIFLLVSLFQFFPAFLAAVIFYVLSKPFVQWLVKKKKWKKSRAAVLVIIISFFIILLPVVALVSLLYSKIQTLAANPQVINQSIQNLDATIKQKFGIQLISADTGSEVQHFITNILTIVLSQGLNFFSAVIMMYFLLYFLLISMNRIEAGIVFYLPFPRSKIMLFGHELVGQTFSNAVGIPLIMVVEGVFSYFGYLIAGLPQAGLWGVVTGVASLIPLVGTGLVWAPVSAYFFITGNNWQGVFILVWGVIVLGMLDNVVRFLLAKKMADVHPIVTVLGVIMGIKYFGIIGLIIGPLLISYFILLLRIYYTEYEQPKKIKVVKRQQWPRYLKPWTGTKKAVAKVTE